MTSTTASANRASVNVGKLLTRLSIVMIAAAVFYWLGKNFLDDPQQFLSVGVTGLAN